MASSVFAVPLAPTDAPSPTPAVTSRPARIHREPLQVSSVDIAAPHQIMRYNNAVYYPNYHLQSVPPKAPASMNGRGHISHLFYSHASVQMDGNVQLSLHYEDTVKNVDNHLGGIAAAQHLRDDNPGLKIILCIGGGLDSFNAAFTATAADAGRRRRFARTAKDLALRYNFDGIDIYWAGLRRKEDSDHFIELLNELRREMPSPRHMVTATLMASPWLVSELDVLAVAHRVDLINLKAFDFVDYGTGKAGHCSQTNAPDTDDEDLLRATVSGAVMYYVQHSRVPATKINIGIPCFGRSFVGAHRIGDKWSHIGRNGNGGIIPYHDLHRLGEHDLRAGASWCAGGPDGFVSYDNPASVACKADLVKNHKLGGLCFFDAPLDHRDDRLSLVVAGYRNLFSPN